MRSLNWRRITLRLVLSHLINHVIRLETTRRWKEERRIALRKVKDGTYHYNEEEVKAALDDKPLRIGPAYAAYALCSLEWKEKNLNIYHPFHGLDLIWK